MILENVSHHLSHQMCNGGKVCLVGEHPDIAHIFEPLIVTLPNTPFKASRKSITGSSHLIVWEVIFQFIPASQF
jgi:hypothetical protein